MQVHTSLNVATPQNIVNAAISAFNSQDSVEKHKSYAPIDKARLLANDALYIDVPPYSLFYRVAVALAATVDKEETKALFGLGDTQIDVITKRAKSSLETGHEKTWGVFNQIERTAKKDGYIVPELTHVKAPASDEKSETIRRLFNPAPLPPLAKPSTDFTKTTNPSTPSEPTLKITETTAPKPTSTSRSPISIKPRANLATDMAKATARSTADKQPAQTRKRSELTLDKNITSLTIPKIVEACMALHDEMGLGLVSKEEFTNRGFVTPNAARVRELVAYTAYRVLPFTSYSLDRIESGVGITDERVKDTLERVAKKIGIQDKSTTTFLHRLGDKLGLTDHQKTLLFVPQKTRFKSWHDLQALVAPTDPSPSQSPAAP